MREHLPAVFLSMRVISHICLRMAFSSHGTLVSVPLCGVGLRQVWLVDPVFFRPVLKHGPRSLAHVRALG